MSDKNLFQLSMHVGLSYTDLGQYDDAIAAYTEAINLDPENHWSYESRGHAYRGKFHNSGRNPEDAKKALEDFTKAKEFYSEPFNICIHVGHSHMDLGQYDDAIVAYTEAIDIAPQDYHGYECRGYAYREKFHNSGKNPEDAKKALEDFTKAKEFYEESEQPPF